MHSSFIINTLEQNKSVFESLLLNLSQPEYLYRPHPGHWCILEIVCHLYDEEQDDFRTRTKTVLETPGTPPPPIDPAAWVKERDYISRNYDIMVHKFLDQRQVSIDWLHALQEPSWDNYYEHNKLGKLTAGHFLANWLAHDYIHIRQINRVKYHYLEANSDENLGYAGNW